MLGAELGFEEIRNRYVKFFEGRKSRDRIENNVLWVGFCEVFKELFIIVSRDCCDGAGENTRAGKSGEDEGREFNHGCELEVINGTWMLSRHNQEAVLYLPPIYTHSLIIFVCYGVRRGGQGVQQYPGQPPNPILCWLPEQGGGEALQAYMTRLRHPKGEVSGSVKRGCGQVETVVERTAACFSLIELQV